MHFGISTIQNAPDVVNRTYSKQTYTHYMYTILYISTCLCLFPLCWIYPACLYRLYRKLRSFWISCALRVALLNPHCPLYISYIAESNALLIRRRSSQLMTPPALPTADVDCAALLLLLLLGAIHSLL